MRLVGARRVLAFVALTSLAALAGCRGEEGVIRVVDGDVMLSRYVPAEAYSAFLAGALAEADGRLDVASARYRDALSIDDGDPLVWARFGLVTCKLPGKRREASQAIARALALDPALSTALESEGECAALEKDAPLAARALLAAATSEPRRAELDARANALLAEAMPEQARARMLAATRAFEERPEAWDALLSWSLERGDSTLAVHAARGLATTRPAKLATLTRAALSLAGLGALDAARAVAELALAGKPDGVGSDTFVARLAVDGALLRGDLHRAEVLAARGHVPLGEVAARAALLGRIDAARSLAEEVARAEPGDRDAMSVLGALSGKLEGSGAPGPSDLSAAAFVVLAEGLSVRAGSAAARAFGAAARHAPIDGRDALVVGAAVELSATGVLSPETDAERVELALRRGEPAPLLPALDARHELAARLLGPPSEPDARTLLLLGRLSGVVGRDPLVTYAVLERQHRIRALTPAELTALEHAPVDPLLLALRVTIAPAEHKDREKRRLAVLARTPYEQRLSAL